MQTLSEIRAMLDERGLHPRKRFGQNFLHDHNQLRRLLDAADVQAGDRVLEVGPGTGALTEALVERGASVIAVEVDRDLAGIIEQRLGGRITLLICDALDKGRQLARPVRDALGEKPFTLVANLPYQIASPLIAALLIEHPNCRGQYVTIQREVADRLLAEPGTKAYGPLTIIIAALADVRRIATLPPGCFWPEPKVTSAMIAVLPRDQPLADDPAGFARFVATVFSRRRKQLGTILGRDRDWPAGVTPDLRPEKLTVEQLVALWRDGAAAWIR